MVKRPLILLAGSAVASATGAAVGIVGGIQVRRGLDELALHERRLNERHGEHLAQADRTQVAVSSLGSVQEQARTQVVARTASFLERHAKQVRVQDRLLLDKVEGTAVEVVAAPKPNLDVTGWVVAGAGTAAAALSTPVVTRRVVYKVGRAGTGAKIAGLHGAAADNAIRAYAGGGPKSMGGGGKALGDLVAKVLAGSSGVLVGGTAVKIQGSKKLADAAECGRWVDAEIATLDLRDEHLRGYATRAQEIEGTLTGLINRAVAALDELESEQYDNTDEVHVGRLERALILARAVNKAANVKMIHEDDSANELVVTYREQQEESPDA